MLSPSGAHAPKMLRAAVRRRPSCKRGAQLVGEAVQYKDAYRLCYIRGPEGLLIGLAQELRLSAYEDNNEERPTSAIKARSASKVRLR